ncbi:MAG: DUF2393 family protein [Campylobacterota bacterium]|nr:DUF2393 family protein [Campylobacterota bacterium]
MNQQITAFLDGLILYDYLLLGGSLLLFVLLLILAVLLRKKLLLALLLILLAFTAIILGPTVGYTKLHDFIFSNNISIREVKALEFTQALIVWGDLNNTSSRHFSECAITAEVYKVANNPVLDALYPLNPFKKATILTEDIAAGGSRSYKIIIEPFTYSREYNLSVGAKCR